jgi:hypothetical protein
MSIYFCIADFVIKIESVYKFQPVPPLLEKFQLRKIPKSPDLIITIKQSSPPLPLSSKTLLFRNGKEWEIHTEGKNLILRDLFNFYRAGCIRTLFITRNSSRHDFYFQGSVPSLKNPLLYPLGQLLILDQLGRSTGLSLHAAGIKDKDGKAFIFCGNSGSGKTTISKIWVKNKKGVSLHDDRIIVRKSGNQILGYGCPWFTKQENLISNQKAPVKKIFFLKPVKGKNKIIKLSPQDAFSNLLQNAYYPLWDKKSIRSSLAFLNWISKNIECWELKFKATPKVIDLVRKLK